MTLRLAALWNLVGAAVALFFADFHFASVYAVPIPQSDGVMLIHRTLWLLIAVLGVCYGIAASSPRFRDGILLVGIIGKTMVFVAWTIAFAQGLGTPLLCAGAVGDLLWAVYFASLLRRR